MTERSLRRVATVAVEVAALFAALVALAALSAALAYPTTDYLRVDLWLGVLLLPGWLLAPLIPSPAGVAGRVWAAATIALVVYAVLALACLVLGLSFAAFYGAFVAAVAVALVVRLRAGTPVSLVTIARELRPGDVIVALATACLVVLFYRRPYSNDLWQFMGHVTDMMERRDFAVSLFGMESLSFDTAMPRYRAHLVHALVAVLGDLSGLNALALQHYLLPVPIGALLVVTLYTFVRGVVGPQVPALAILLGLLAPVTIVWRPEAAYSPYDWAFRFLNNPVLDKDFGLLVVLPSLLLLGVLWIRDGVPQHLALLLALALVANFFHPMIVVYFALATPVLAGAFFSVARRRLAVVVAVAGAAFAACVTLGFASGYHDAIDAIVRHDWMTRGGHSYWSGHYATFTDSETITHAGGWMRLRLDLALSNALILYSVPATLVWAAWIGMRLRRGVDVLPEERQAFRLQVGFVAMLAGIWAASPLFLGVAPFLWRGYERLHWGYFGVFSLVAVATLVAEGARRLAGDGPLARRALAALGTALFVGFAADQCVAMRGDTTPWLDGALPGLHSRIGSPMFRAGISGWADEVFRTMADPGRRRRWFRRPAWLRADDRVLAPALPMGTAAWYACQRQAVYWPELYGEGYAYALRGDAFLAEWEAFRDAAALEPSERLAAWMRAKGVTILITTMAAPPERIAAFVHGLEARLGARLEPVAPDVYRITRPAGA